MQRKSLEKESRASPDISSPRNKQASASMQLHPLSQLQRAVGNRSVQRLLRGSVTEALPSSVNHTPAIKSSAQATRSSAAGSDSETQESESPGKAGSAERGALSPPAPPDENGTNRAGQRLDSSTRSFMEARFGRDFSDVRVHSDAASAKVADSFDAHAVTSGSEIHFERGGYSPETQQGRAMLAHELAHVVQNERGSSGARASEASLEAEAAVASQQAAAGQTAQVHLGSQAPSLKLSRGAKTAVGVGLGAVVGGIVGAIGLGVAQGFGANISGDVSNKVLFGAMGAGALVGGLIGLFSKEKEQELPAEETETDAEKAQDFNTRLNRWLLRGLNKLHGSSCRFPTGEWRYDERYWELVTDTPPPHFRSYKPKGIPPALAIDRLFQNLDKWDFDCAIYPEVAMAYAFRHALGTDEFNRKFSDLIIRQHRTTGIPWELHEVKEGKEAFDKLWDESPAGTKITWTNRSTAVKNDSAWKHENGIKRFKGQTPAEDRFDAFPIGANLSEKEVMRGLAEAGDDFPRSGGESAKQAYVDTNIFRDQLQLLKVS